jgi:hypothetical protein
VSRDNNNNNNNNKIIIITEISIMQDGEHFNALFESCEIYGCSMCFFISVIILVMNLAANEFKSTKIIQLWTM